MSTPRTTVRIANIPVPVPIYGDEAATQELAAKLNRLYDRMEAEVGRIDTPVVALRMAWELALEIASVRDEAADQEAALTAAMADLATTLERVIAKHEAQGPKAR